MFERVGQFFSPPVQALKRAAGLGSPIPREVLQRALFANGPVVSMGDPLLSGHSMGSVSIVGDYNSLYRSTKDLAASFITQYPGSSFDWMKDLFSSKDMIMGYQTFGSVTGINFILGLVKMVHASSQIGYADAIEDRKGSVMGRIGILESASLGGAGASFGTFRVLSIIDTVREIQPGSLLGRVSYGFAMAGLSFYSLFFAFLSVTFGIQLFEGYKLKNKLNRAEDFVEKMEILQRKLQVQPDKVYEKLMQKHGSDAAVRKVLIDEAYDAGKENLRKVLKELNIKDVSDEKLKKVMLSGTGIDEEKLMQTGLKMKVQKTQLKKQAKMGRILNSAGVEAMQKLQSETTLAKRVKLGDKTAIANANKLVNVIKEANQKKITEAAVVISVLIFGIVTLTAAMVFTGGTSLLVSDTLMLLFTIVMTLVDGYYLLQSYREERPAPHDKKMLLLSSVLGLTSLLMMMGLGASGVLSVGVVPLVIALVLTGLWLGQNGVTWAVLNRNERRYQDKNPTLETLLKALDADERDRVELMMKNLSEMHRQMIQSEMKQSHGDMKEATRAVIQKIEFTKKAHLESLREAITPQLVNVAAS